uniref:Cytochrome b n=1 Tax=Amblyseius obtuserellus TaxID=3061186 RepID=A0AAU6PCK9_9ACAR
MTFMIKSLYTPMPANISYWWNFGSLLGACIAVQILSGIFLSFFYENDMENTFNSISQIERNINNGWIIRSLHANGASFFFLFIYLHIGRGLYFQSFILTEVWFSGIIMLFLLFATAFIGYVLPWGQMSFWGATVITNLVSSIPYIGKTVTIWLWGNFAVSKATLMRFFSFHFILPLILLLFIMIHIFLLHKTGSNNPLGSPSNMDKIPFYPYFIWKDLVSLGVFMVLLITVALLYPSALMDSDNFIPANPMVTPPHIQPEWYFLFAYAILRVIPNKLGGVICLVLSILILVTPPLIFKAMANFYTQLNNQFLFKLSFFCWLLNFIYLTFLGAMMIEPPFTSLSMITSLVYFSLFFFMLMIKNF